MGAADRSGQPCSQTAFEALHRPDCEHGFTDDYPPYYDSQGEIQYPTEQEAEYPDGLCVAYAKAVREEMDAQNQWPEEASFRLQQIAGELTKYSRFRHRPARKGGKANL